MHEINLGASGTYGTGPLARARADMLRIDWQRFTLAWDVIQPSKNIWNWAAMDATIEAWKHLHLCALLHRWPPWICTNVSGSGTWLVSQNELVDSFTIFCQEIYKQYGDIFALIQPTNEPWSNILPVTSPTEVAPLIARLGKAAQNTFKSTAIAGPSLQSPTPNNSPMIGAHKSHHSAGFPCQWIDYHDYSEETVGGESIDEYINNVRLVWGFLPVVVSELGIFEAAGPDKAAITAIKYASQPFTVCFVQNLLGSGNGPREGFVNTPNSMELRPSMKSFIDNWFFVKGKMFKNSDYSNITVLKV